MSAAGTSDSLALSMPRAPWLVRLREGIIGRGAVVPLLVAHGVSAAGDAFVTVSLAGSLFFNVSPNASREQVLLYLVITMAPLAVLSPLVGPAVDRFRRSQRFVAATFYIGRGVLCLALAAMLLQLGFYPIALAVLIVSKASGIVKQTLVQTLVEDPTELVATNARLARFATITAALGVAAGSGVYAAFGAEWSLRGAALLLALAGVIVLRVRPSAEPPTPHQELDYLETHLPLVVLSSAGMLAIRAAVGFFVFTLAFTLRRSSEPAAVYGVAAAFYAGGAFAGHTAATMLRRRFREEHLIGGAIALPAVFGAVGVLGVSIPLLMVISMMVGLSTTLGRNAFDGLLQHRAPAALLGRTGARYETRFQLAWVFGGVLATPISLPVEISMMVLTVIYLPALVVVFRGVSEARHYEDLAEDQLGRAQFRLALANRSWETGALRAAIVDAFAAVDLAQTVTRRVVDGRDELDGLRRQALDLDADVRESDVMRALQLAERAISAASRE